MKFNSRKFGGAFTLCQLLILLAVVALFAAFAIPKAAAQVDSKEYRLFTNVTAVAASTATNVNRSLDLRNGNGKGHWILTSFAASASDTDPVTFWFYPKPDGTNRLTTHPLYLSAAANGTTGVITGTNLNGTIWDGCKQITLATISNAHASATVYVTNVWLINSR